MQTRNYWKSLGKSATQTILERKEMKLGHGELDGERQGRENTRVIAKPEATEEVCD